MSDGKKNKRLGMIFLGVLGIFIIAAAIIIYKSDMFKKRITIVKEENIPQGLIVTGKSCNGMIGEAVVDPGSGYVFGSENCGDGNSVLRVWKIYSGKKKIALKVSGSNPRFAISNNARFLAVCDYANPGRIRIYNLDEFTYKDFQISSSGNEEILTRFTLSPDGRYLLLTADGHEVRIFDTLTLKELKSKKLPERISDRGIYFPYMRSSFLTLSYNLPIEDMGYDPNKGPQPKHFKPVFRVWDLESNKAVYEYKTEDTVTLKENQDEPEITFGTTRDADYVIWNKKLVLFNRSEKINVEQKNLDINYDETAALALRNEDRKPDKLILANYDGLIFEYNINTEKKSVLADLRKHFLALRPSAVSVTGGCVIYASVNRLIVYDVNTNQTRILE